MDTGLKNYSVEELTKTVSKYKAIEEELGIDLVTLSKALKNGIYVKNTGVGNTNWNKDIITKVKVPCLKLDSDAGKTLRFEQKRRYWVDTYELKDYGKTWALTKKELQDVSNN